MLKSLKKYTYTNVFYILLEQLKVLCGIKLLEPYLQIGSTSFAVKINIVVKNGQ